MGESEYLRDSGNGPVITTCDFGFAAFISPPCEGLFPKCVS